MRKPSHARLTAPQKERELEGWDLAIAEAESQITRYEEGIAKLRLSIGTFQQMKERGEPFMPEPVAAKLRAA